MQHNNPTSSIHLGALPQRIKQTLPDGKPRPFDCTYVKANGLIASIQQATYIRFEPRPPHIAALTLAAAILLLLLHARAHAQPAPAGTPPSPPCTGAWGATAPPQRTRGITPPPGQAIAAEARRHIGAREATGRNDGPHVARYLAHVGLPEGYPWCAAFVCYVLHHAGVPSAPRTAWSPALFPPSRTIYRRGQASPPALQPGDVFGIYYPARGRIAHVGIIEQPPDGRWVYTVEGNTNPAGSREGHGVYRKRRPLRQLYKAARYN